MDPVSQGGLGAALAAGTAGRRRLLAAVCLGGLSGMAADLDVVIRSPADPLLFLEYHRQFTHALAFVPVGALLCALIAHPLARRWLAFRDTLLFCLLGYASHGLLDACTSYGTQLLWPFSTARVAWNNVSVVDPLFTLPLLILLGLAVGRGRVGPARAALVWVVVYLGLGLLQGWRAERAGAALADARGHVAARLLAKPSFGNLLVWKLVYQSGDRYHVDAVRLGARPSYYPGETAAVLDDRRQLPWLTAGSRQDQDLQRFRAFSDDYLALDPDVPGRVIDIRYSMVPNRIDGLWGLELDAAAQDQHARFVTDRGSGRAAGSVLLQMLVRPGVPLDQLARAD